MHKAKESRNGFMPMLRQYVVMSLLSVMLVMGVVPGGMGPKTSGGGNKSSSSGGGIGGRAHFNTVLMGIIVIGVGLICMGIVIDVFADLISTTNMDNFTGLEEILTIIPTVAVIGLVFSGGFTAWLGAGGGQLSMRDAIQAPIMLVIGGVLVPFVVTIAAGLLANANLSTFTGLDVVLGIVPTLVALGLMGVAGYKLWGQWKSSKKL